MLTLSLSTLAIRLTETWQSLTGQRQPKRMRTKLAWNLEHLESREMLTVFTVNTILDETTNSETTSLREAISLANAHPGEDQIVFSDAAVGTIDLLFGELSITDSVTITGNGATRTVIDAQQTSRIFDIGSNVDFAVFESLTVTNGRTTGDDQSGGGIRSLAHSLTIINSAIVNNSTTGDGSHGGGLFAQDAEVSIVSTTLSGNSTSGADSGGSAVRVTGGTLNVQNSTVSGNTSAAAGSGGAMMIDHGGLAVSNSTVVYNTSLSATVGGGGITANSSDVTLVNSIIALNVNAVAPDLAVTGASFSAIHTLIGNHQGTSLTAAYLPDSNGNLVGSNSAPIDPRLDPLAYNSGLTQTHALRADSPAIDGGLDTLVADAADQRGAPFDRIAGASVDMGSFERQAYVLQVTTADDEADATYDPNDLSLREALAITNAYPGMDLITFSASLEGIPLLLTRGELSITDTVRINGLGVNLTIIDAQSLSRVFYISETAGDVYLQGLTVTNGRTAETGAGGGGIRSASPGTLTLSDTSVTGNTTEGLNSPGGGLLIAAESNLVLTNSTISANTTLSSGSGGGGIYGAAGGNLLISGTRIADNSTTAAQSAAGGLYWHDGSVTITEGIVTGNSTYGASSPGGGIASNHAAINTMATTVSENATFGMNSAGGGVYVTDSAVSLRSSTVSQNVTHGQTSPGGGVRVDGGSLTIVNSTIASNTTGDSESGGGGLSVGSAALSLTNSTVAANNAGAEGAGGGIAAATGPVTLANSIIAENLNSAAPDLAPGTGVLTMTHSLIGDNTGTTLIAASLGFTDSLGNVIGSGIAPIDPQLGPLAAFGGPTKTFSLQPNSPAINAGSNSLAPDLPLDQRGLTRVFDGIVDMGAFEHQSALIEPVVTFSTSVLPVSEGAGTVEITVSLSFSFSRNVTVPILVGGTATNAIDYAISATSLIIPAGATSGVIYLTIHDDGLYESHETVSLSLGTILDGVLGGVPDETVIINSNDAQPSVAFSIGAQSIAENGGSIDAIVVLSAPSGLDTIIPFSWSGDAASPADFQTSSDSPLVIPAGQTSATVRVTVIDDAAFETNESITLTLSNPTNATVGAHSAQTITILDNDNSPPVLSNPGPVATYRYNPRETRSPVAVFSTITISDQDGPVALSSLVISVSLHSGKNRDVYAFSGLSSIGTLEDVITNGRREFRLTLSAGTTNLQVQALLRSMTFETSKAGLRKAQRDFQVTVTDHGGLSSNVLTQTVAVSKN